MQHTDTLRRTPPLRTLGAALLLSLGLGLTPGPLAGAEERSGLLSRDEAVALVRERTDGRILSVDRVGEENGQFRIRVLVREGEVRVFRVDRATGRIR